LGLLTCKNRLPYNLYCVVWDVKHGSIESNLGAGLKEVKAEREEREGREGRNGEREEGRS